MAKLAFAMNEQNENIGARRLHTMLEKLLEDVMFMTAENETNYVVIDKAYVEEKLNDLMVDKDFSKFIL